VVAEIQSHSQPVIEQTYRQFLLQSHDAEEREYPDAVDEIREVLIHKNYFSQKDIDICLAYDVSRHTGDANYKAMADLHQTLRDAYPDAATESVY
jgi:hypothetical protein